MPIETAAAVTSTSGLSSQRLGVGVPTLPTNIVVAMMRRRSGWLTTFSVSDVVKPAPLKAERAWNAATSGGVPVAIRAPVASRTNTMETTATTTKVAMAYTRG